MSRFWIVPVALATLLVGCNKAPPATQAAAIYRPSPTDPTPMGIAYLCDGRKEVNVVYAKARASVTFEGKTWRLEYQASDGGLRYSDTSVEWQGRDDLVALRQLRDNRALAFNCRPARQT
jgi:membrane-bound inhibitor of C-type lysozyme